MLDFNLSFDNFMSLFNLSFDNFMSLFYVIFALFIIIIIGGVIYQVKKHLNTKRLYEQNKHSGKEFEGKVNGFSAKSESYGNPSNPMWTFRNSRLKIWTFQILQFDEKIGNSLQKIPVEIKGRRFDGFINDGDTIRVKGKWKEGEILKVDELFNVTNNIWVTVRAW